MAGRKEEFSSDADPLGSPWSEQYASNGCKAVSGHVQAKGASESSWYADTVNKFGSANGEQWCEVVMDTINSFQGPRVRIHGTSNYGYQCRPQSATSIRIYRVASDWSQTQISGSPITVPTIADVTTLRIIITADDAISIIVDGTTYAVGTDSNYDGDMAGFTVFSAAANTNLIDSVEWGEPGGGETKTITDLGSGSDALGALGVSVGVSDAGLGSESMPIGAAVPAADTGQGSDAIAAISAALSVADAGHGTEGQAIGVRLTITEAGQGSDLPAIHVALSIADSGSGADAISLLTAILKTVTDLGGGTEAPSISAAVPIPDSGQGSDAPVISASISVADLGSGLDSIIALILKTVADAAHGSDTLSVAVSIPVADLGHGSEATLIAALLCITELGAGADSISITGAGVARIVTVRFSIRKPSVTFTIKKPTVQFAMKKPRVDFEMLD